MNDLQSTSHDWFSFLFFPAILSIMTTVMYLRQETHMTNTAVRSITCTFQRYKNFKIKFGSRNGVLESPSCRELLWFQRSVG